MQIAQIIISVIIVILILLQERSAGMSGLFGGGGGDGGHYQARRGIEKFVFAGTIIFGVIFLALSVAKLLFS